MGRAYLNDEKSAITGVDKNLPKITGKLKKKIKRITIHGPQRGTHLRFSISNLYASV